MTAIAGMVDTAGAGLDRALLVRTCSSLCRRKPDPDMLWYEGAIGMAPAAALQGAPGPAVPRIAFDGRIDARDELIATLVRSADAPLAHASDAQLVLHAYRAWGEHCASRLLGDFAFALWDPVARRLFCARDRFGVRPFYYLFGAGGFVFASDMEALLSLPATSAETDESALADFLLFGYDRDPTSTPFRRIRQLAPAHTLTVSGGTLQSRRYWLLPAPRQATYGDPIEHVREFRSLLDLAVADRTREGSAAVLLSGGLDSTSIAASCRTLTRAGGEHCRLDAYTVTATDLCPEDKEGHFARIGANALDMRFQTLSIDATAPFERWHEAVPRSLAPVYSPFHASHMDLMRRIAVDGHLVLLSGEGGDPGMLVAPQYCAALAGDFHWLALLQEVLGQWRFHGTLRSIGWRRMLRLGQPAAAAVPEFPAWLDCAWAKRLDLRERWQRYHAPADANGGVNEAMHEDLTDSAWTETRFRQDEGVWTDAEMRYPFYDLRVIEHVATLPQFLRRDKRILRESMRGRLPDIVRTRPKTPFAGDLIRAWLLKHGSTVPASWSTSALSGWVDAGKHQLALQRYLSGDGHAWPWDGIMLAAPVGLDRWLRNLQRGNGH